MGMQGMRGTRRARLGVMGIAMALLAAALAPGTQAQGLAGPLELARLKDYEARRATSNNVYVESNDDSKRPIPGETIVLADLEGPGVVTHIWMTLAANEYGWPRLLRFRVYYDGSLTPSIDVPLGDFFAVGHGYERNVDSLMIRNTSNGRARNSYWAMPFRRSCRITITNEGSRRVSMLYYQVDWQKHRELPADVGYLHALYRQELPAAAGRDYTALDVKGRGHLAGAVVNVIQTEAGWFGEGDDLFYVDGAPTPALEGTGTEDYFLDAWGLRASTGLMVGIPIAEGRHVGARLSGYRWHLSDPVPFTTSLRFDIEHKGWKQDPDPKKVDGFHERFDLWSSVAFWYQEGVNEDLPEMPYGRARLPHGNARQIEVEDLAAEATSSGGELRVQREVFWSKDLLFLRAEGPRARVAIPVDIAEDGTYELVALVAHARDYGIYDVTIDGVPLGRAPGHGIAAPIDAYGPELYVAADHLLGWFELAKGRHTIEFTCLGKNEQATAHYLGIDGLVVSRVADRVRSTASTPTPAPAQDSATASAAPPGAPPYSRRPLQAHLSAFGASAADERAAAARAVGRFAPEATAAVAPLVALVGDPDAAVREAAVEALVAFGPSAAPAVGRLTPLLADPSPRMRGLAALALREIGRASEPALPALIAALADRDLVVRYEVGLAIAALGAAAKPAVRPLMAAMDEEPDEWVSIARRDMRRAMAIALGAIGPDAREALPLLRKWMAFYRVAWVAAPVIRKIEGLPEPARYRP